MQTEYIMTCLSMPVSFHPHLEDLLAGHLNAAVASLGLLLGQLLAKDLELLNKVPLVLGHREALCLLRELTGGHQSLLGLILQLVLPAEGQTEGETERGKDTTWDIRERGETERQREIQTGTNRGMRKKKGEPFRVPITNTNKPTYRTKVSSTRAKIT